MRLQRLILNFFLMMIGLQVSPAQAFHLGIGITGDYFPSLQYKLSQNQGRFMYKGQGSTLSLYGTGSIAGMESNFGFYASQAQFTNAYTESTESDPGLEKITKLAAGASVTSYPNKGAWLMTRVSLGLNQLAIEQTGDTPVKQTYSIGGEAMVTVGLAPPPGKQGLSLELTYLSSLHMNGKQEGSSDKKYQDLRGSAIFVSLGATVLIF